MRGEVASSRKWGWRCRGWERSKGHTLAREIGRGAVAVRRLGKFLRDHRLVGCGADGSAIRRDRPGCRGALGAWTRAGRLRHAHGRPLLRRLAHLGYPERAMARDRERRARPRRLRRGGITYMV